MLVSQILASKGDATVVTIRPKATLLYAAHVLAARGIGAVVVSEDGRRADGILSERDIVVALGRRGGVALADAAVTPMTSRPATCQHDDDAEDVLARMTRGRFRHLPVVASGRMEGLISIGDVVKARLEELAAEKDALEGMIKGF